VALYDSAVLTTLYTDVQCGVAKVPMETLHGRVYSIAPANEGLFGVSIQRKRRQATFKMKVYLLERCFVVYSLLLSP